MDKTIEVAAVPNAGIFLRISPEYLAEVLVILGKAHGAFPACFQPVTLAVDSVVEDEDDGALIIHMESA